MNAIHADIARQYDTVLSSEAIAEHYLPENGKWHLFYLYFCRKRIIGCNQPLNYRHAAQGRIKKRMIWPALNRVAATVGDALNKS